MLNKIFSFLLIIFVFVAGYFYYKLVYIPYTIQKQNEVIIQKQNELENKEIEKKEIKLIKLNVEKQELTNNQKIEELKLKKNNYKSFSLKNAANVYFIESDDKLDLFLDDIKVWTFSLVYPEFLRVELVESTLNDLYIEVWNEKFYYNSLTKLITKIDLNIDIFYVKKSLNNNLILVTKQWSFVFNLSNKKLEYFSFFNDFLFFWEWYIWLVTKDDEIVINNLWLSHDKTQIVYYNPITKDKQIIYSVNSVYYKIYLQDWKLVLEDNDNQNYELENFSVNIK